MYKIRFIYQSLDYSIQCEANEKIKDIYERCLSENNLNIANSYLLYNGEIIDKEKSFQELANFEDKGKKIMSIIIASAYQSIVEQKKIKSKETICSECGENSLLNINNYKINLYGCKNKHQKNNILLNEYEETQIIDITKILCNKCKINKKSNRFYFCGTCNVNLCQNCKSDHKQGHKIIEYEDKLYKCYKHKYSYSGYCRKCNLNICSSCAKEHLNHYVIDLKKIIPKKQDLLNDIINLRKIIDNFNSNIKTLIKDLENIFKKVEDNMEIYYKIYKELIDNYDGSNHINYNKIQNINEFQKYNNTINNDINEFIKYINITDKINSIMKIYLNMKNIKNKDVENKIQKEQKNITKRENKDNKPIKNETSKKIEKEKKTKENNTKKMPINKVKQNNISNKKSNIIKNKNNKENGYYNFNKEIIFIHVGQAGIDLGDSIWELFSIEHGIYNGESNENKQPFANKIFTEAKNGIFYANSIFIDSDSSNIDRIEAGPHKYLFESDSFVSGNEDASKNYAKGYYTIGTNMINTSMNKIRKLAENCSNLGGFVFTNAVGGGTGSGLGSLLLENICISYDKKLRINFPIYPSSKLSNNDKEPYNCVFSTHELLEYSDIAIMLDNDALYDICKKKLDIIKPNYINLNRLTAQVISSFINSEKDVYPDNCNLKGLIDYLIPTPRLHFMLSSYSPILTIEIACFEQLNVKDITNYVFEPNSMMVKFDKYSLMNNNYIKCGLIYRGDVNAKEVFNYMDIFPTKKIYEIINIHPNHFKYNFSYHPPSVIPGGDLPKFMRDVCMISNHTVMNEFISKFNDQFDKLYDKKENIQLYLNEDMEEAEFKEARENLGLVVKEYKDYPNN